MSSTVKCFQIFFSLKMKTNISVKTEILPCIDLFMRRHLILCLQPYLFRCCWSFLNYLLETLFLLNFCNLAASHQVKSLILIKLHQNFGLSFTPYETKNFNTSHPTPQVLLLGLVALYSLFSLILNDYRF